MFWRGVIHNTAGKKWIWLPLQLAYHCAVYDECKYSDTFWLQIVLVCLYTTPSRCHHCANLSEGIELINCLSDIVCRVLSIIQHAGLYVFNLPISLVMIQRIYILCLIIIIKSGSDYDANSPAEVASSYAYQPITHTPGNLNSRSLFSFHGNLVKALVASEDNCPVGF